MFLDSSLTLQSLNGSQGLSLVFSVSYVSDHYLLFLGREVEGGEVSSGRGKEGGRAMEGSVTEEGN